MTNPGEIAGDENGISGYSPSTITSVSAATVTGGTRYYGWDYSVDGMTWIHISGATSATYKPGAITQTRYYRRKVSNTGYSAWEMYSNIISKVVCPLTLDLDATNPNCGSSDGTIVATGANGLGGSGAATLMGWYNISGGNVSNLTSNSAYPNSPSYTGTVATTESFIDVLDNFGGRINGYIIPDKTGTHYFWIASDDSGEFWLSTDNSPSNKVRRAYNTAYTGVREWNKYATQKSVAINLVAGEVYYFEALYKENGGGDHLAVGWSKPGESTTTPAELIPGTDLRPFSGTAATDPVYQYKIGSGAYQNSNTFTGLAAGTYTISVKDTYGCITTATQTLTAPAALSTTVSSNSPVCVGGTLNLTTGTVTGGGSETPTYSWTGPGGFTSTLQNPTRSNMTTGMAGTYTLTVTRGNCSGTFTTNVVVTSPPSATITSTNPTCGSSDGTITFTFPSNLTTSVQISLNNGSTYPYTVSAGSGSYMITGQAAGTKTIKMKWGSAPACESAATVLNMTAGTNLPAMEITSPDETLCEGGSFTLSSNAIGSGPYSLQWQELNGSTWSDILLAVGTSYTKLLATEGSKSYRLRASLVGCTTTYSNIFTVNVVSQPTVTITAPVSTICLNQTTTLTSSVSQDAGTITYRWQRSLLNTIDWADISGATSDTYSPPTGSAGTWYYRVIATPSGKNCNPATSNSVGLTVVNPGTTVTPATTTLCVGGTQMLTASGTFARVWQRSSDNGATWVDLPATTTTFSPDNSAAGTFRYRVRVTVPSCGTFFSSEATIVVNDPPVVTVSTTRPDVCIGGTATLTGSVSNSTGTLSYQWVTSSTENGTYTNVTNGSGATTLNYTPVTTTAGIFYYKLRVNSTASSCGPVDSPVLIFDVMPPLSVGITPSSTLICQNSVNNLTANLTGGVGPFTYQWQVSTTSSTTGFSNISGATSASYQFPTGTVGSRHYRVIVTPAANLGCNAVTSAGYTVTVSALPTASLSNTSTTGVYSNNAQAVSTSQCVGTLFTLFANPSASPVTVSGYSWSGPAGFSSTDQNPTGLASTSSSAGFYTVTLTGSNGCTNTAQTEVKITANCDGKCTGIIDVRPTNPSSCTATDGSITVTEWGAGLYETSMDGYTWFASEKVFSGLALGRYLVYLRDKTSRLICRTVYITIEAKSTFSSAPVATSASGCKSATGSIALPTDVLSTDKVSWISSRNPTYVTVSTLPQVGGKRIIQNLTPGTYYVKVIRGGELCYREQMVTVGNTGTPCISNQICTTTNLVNLFPNGDFGSGTAKHGPVLTTSETQYGYSLYNCNAPNDGFYSIVNTTDCNGSGGKTFGGAGGAGGWDVLYEDHTPGDVGGYMMVVNASHNPDIVVEKSISNLCPKTQYNFTAWIYNLIPNEVIKPNLSFLIDGVVYYVTGSITTNGWRQVGFSFTTGDITSSVFSIRNNAPGGDGNDWLIDDIVVSKCPLTINMSANVVACVGTTNKTITATVSDPYQEYNYYKWQESTDGVTWTDVTTVTSGTYSGGSMTVSTVLPGPFTNAQNGKRYRIKLATTAASIDDATCSMTSGEATLTVPEITASVTPPVIKCAGAGSTILVAQGAGGSTPYTYAWDNGLGSGASKTVNPTTTTNYTVTATDANGCSATATTSVTIKPLPVATATGTTICSGTAFSVTPNSSLSGTQYTWTAAIQTAPSGGTITGFSANTTASDAPVTQTLTNSGTTSGVVRYTVTPVADGCNGATFTFDVTVRPTINATASGTTVCSGAAFSITPTSNISGTQYTWTTSVVTAPTGGTVTGHAGQATAVSGPIAQTLSNSGTTNGVIRYTVTPVANGCSGASFSFDVTVRPNINVTATGSTICTGGTFNITPVSNISGTQYTWTAAVLTAPTGGTLSGFSNNSTAANAPIAQTLTNSGTSIGVVRYTITPVANGCNATPVTVDITVNPVVTALAGPATICSGATFSVTPTANISGTKYTWTAAVLTAPTGGTLSGFSNQTSAADAPVSQSLTNTGSTPGVVRYTVTPIANGCTGASFTIDVTVNPLVNASATGATICSGSAFSVTPTSNISGTKYTWTAVIQTAPTGGTLSGFSNNTTASDAPISQTLTNTGTTPGVVRYTVTAVANGCNSSTFTFDVTVNPTIIASATGTTICSGSAFSVTPTSNISGTKYTWTAVVQTAPTGGTLSGFSNNTTASDAPISQTLTNTGTTAGVVRYTVTAVANGCNSSTFTFDVTVNPTIIASATGATICSGSAFSVTPTSNISGTKYTWTAVIQTAPTGGTLSGFSNNTTASDAPISQILTNTGTIAGVVRYTVTAVANGCNSSTFTFDVTVNPTIVASATGATICSGSAFSVTPTSNISGTKYTWTAVIQTAPTGGTLSGFSNNTTASDAPISQTLTNTGTTAGVVRYTVTAVANGCNSSTFTFDVTVNPTIIASATGATICSGAAFSVTPTSNISGTKYTWTAVIQTAPTGGTLSGFSNNTTASDSPISQTLTNTGTTAGVVRYTVTAVANGCNSSTFTFDVTVNPRVIASATGATICSGSAFSVTPTSNISGTKYTWTAVIQTAPTGGTLSGFSNNTTASDAPISQTLTNTGTTPGVVRYTVTAVANGCNSSTFTFDATVNPTIVASATGATICSGSAFSVTPTSNISGTKYTWTAALVSGTVSGFSNNTTASDAPISQTLTNTGTTAGVVRYTVTAVANGCNSSTFTFDVTVNPTIIASATGTTICSGSAFSVTPTSNISGTKYTWTAALVSGTVSGFSNNTTASDAPISQTLTNTGTTAGVVRYTVTAVANGCNSSTFTFDVTVNPTIIASATGATICSGAAFSVTPTSNISGTKYTWTAVIQTVPTGGTLSGFSNNTTASDAPISQTLTNTGTTAGVVRYTVTAVANGCNSSTFTFDVTVNPTIVASATGATICSGSAFSVTPTSNISGTKYTWTAVIQTAPTGGTLSGFSNNTTASDAPISQTLTNTGTTPGVVRYTVTAVANGCNSSTFTFDVTVNPTIIASATGATICSGAAFSVTPTSNISGAKYTWTAALVSGTASGFSNNTTASDAPISQTLTNTGTTAGVVRYTVTAVANGCNSSTFTFDVTVNPRVIASATGATICSGSAFSVTPTSNISGTKYTWTAVIQTAPTGGTLSGFSNNTTASDAPISQTLTNTGTTAGVVRYTVTAVANGCNSSTFTFDVTVNPTIIASATGATICSGSAFSVTPTSNISGTKYTWTAVIQTAPTGGTLSGFSNNSTASDAPISQTLTNTGTTAGVVRYTVTAVANGCNSSTFTFDVTVNPTIIASASGATICSGSTFSVTPTSNISGTKYTWTAVVQTAPTGGTLSGFSNNTTASDAPISQTLTNTGTTAGVVRYTVTAVANGCNSSTFTFDVTVNPTIIASATGATICSGSAFSVTPTSNISGTKYTWTAVVQTAPTGGTLSGFSNNTTASDAPISQTLTNTGTTAGVVRYTVTAVANGCNSSTFTFDVTVNPTIVASATGATICSGSAFSVTPTSNISGAKYTWTAVVQTAPTGGTLSGFSNNSTASDAPISQILTNTGTTAGVVRYTVTAVANGCNSSTFTFDVTVNPTIIASATGATICSGSAFSVTPTSNISGTKYTWTAVIQTAPTGGALSGFSNNTTASDAPISQTLTNTGTTAGVVRYTVTAAANGCNSSTFTFDVTVNPRVTASATGATICSGSAFSVTPTSNISGTKYTWTAALVSGTVSGFSNNTTASDAPISQTLTNTGTTAGVVRYTVTAVANGCNSSTFTFDVTVNPTIIASATGATICSGSAFSVTPTSNISGAKYTWTAVIQTAPTGGTLSGFSNNSTASDAPISQILTNTGTTAGVVRYTVTAVANGCNSSTFTFDVTVNPTIVASATGATICSGSAFSVTPTSNISGTKYTWTAVVQTAPTGGTLSGFSNTTTASDAPISQTLTNTGTTAGVVRYTVTAVANGCNSSTFTFDVTVNPRVIASATGATICSGSAFSVTPTSNISGTKYTWTAVIQTAPTGGTLSGFSNNTTASDAPISQILTNTGTTAGVVRYTVTAVANGCNSSTFTFDVTVNPTIIASATGATICSGSAFSVTPTSNISGTKYTWTAALVSGTVSGFSNNTTASDAPISQTLTNTGTTAGVVRYTVTAAANGCNSSTFTFDVTVNPTIIASATGTTICSGSAFSVTPTSNISGTKYTWTAVIQTAPTGGTLSGFSNNTTASDAPISQTLTNTGTTAGVVRYTVTAVANGCNSSTFTFDVTVNPKPVLTKPADQVVCNNGNVSAVNFSASVAGSTFSWTNNNPSIGLPASGSGNIASFVAINTGNVPVIATITVTPNASCPGETVTFTITVNPTPSVNKPADQSLCTTGLTTAINFTGNVSGTTYTWTNSNPTIGLDASGIGNIPPFTAINNGTSPVTATITVTPVVNGCPGMPQTFLITVNPKPTVTVQVPSNTACIGATLTLTATVSGGSGNHTQQWQVSSDGITWSDVPGQTGLSYTVPTNAASEKYYQVVITDGASGCGSVISDPVKVTVISTVTIGITPNNNRVCIGEELVLTATINNATPGLTYQWYSSVNQSDTVRMVGETGLTLSVPTNVKGIMYYRLQVASPILGCGTVKSGFTSVEVRPLPSVTFTKTDALCEPGNGKIVFSFPDEPTQTTLEFSLDGGLTYPYSVNDNSGTYTIDALSASTYQLYARWGGGACPINVGTTTISDRPAPLVTSSKTDPTCTIQNGTITFNFPDVAGRSGYKFSLDGGLTYMPVVADNSGSVTYAGLAPGTYDLWVKWDNDECPVNLPDLVLTDQKGPTVSLGNDVAICLEASVTITANTSGGAPPLVYTWNNGLGGQSSHVVSPTVTTTYIVLVKDANNCEARDTLVVTVNAKPVVTVSDVEVCENQTIKLSGSGGGTYAWTGPNGFNSALQNPEIPNAKISQHQGAYLLTVTNGFGCESSATSNVLINPLPTPPTATGAEKCGPGSVVLSAGGCSGTISWHNNIFGGNQVGIGTTFATPNLSETTAYFALCSSNKSCDSPVRTTVLAKINTEPVADVIPVDPTCFGNTSADNGRIIISRYRDNEKYSFNIGTAYNSGIANAPALIPANGTISSTLPGPANKISQSYTVRIISNEGCTTDKVVTIQNNCVDCPVDYCPPATVNKIE